MKTISQSLNLISESDPNFDPTKIDPRVRRAIEIASKEKTEDGISLPVELRAKYKIELTYGPQRTLQGPNRIAIQIWESGKRFHGGGDELMFFCKDAREGHEEGCWTPMSPDNIKGGIAFCNKCNMAINAEYLTNSKIGYATSRTIADSVAKLFRQLDFNADIYIKYHKTDMRYKAMLKDKGPEIAKRLKGMHIYPLKNILKETSNGASLEQRIFAFITS